MVFLTDATPAHEFANMKDPIPSMLPLSIMDTVTTEREDTWERIS